MCPRLLSLVVYTSRNACLCTKHQNFALKLKTITPLGGKLSANPDTVAKLSIGEISSLINDLALGKVVFFARKKFDIAFKKGTKELLKKTKIITTEKSKTDFVALFLEEFLDFKGHVERVKN